VIRMYTKQILLGLQYLHKNRIMHRYIKGSNIIVDNKGCIELADFGASKKVVELATMTGAKSMKGTPYWMAPLVIDCFADIWSAGCTLIEMAIRKPPQSQQYQKLESFRNTLIMSLQDENGSSVREKYSSYRLIRAYKFSSIPVPLTRYFSRGGKNDMWGLRYINLSSIHIFFVVARMIRGGKNDSWWQE
ncbi:mitogen-activated protein kinase kinase kinase NPK1, partial [Tanacetum coccineum]